MGVLADIFSASDTIKRRMKDFKQDPKGYLQMVADRVNEALSTPEGATEFALNSVQGPVGITRWFHASPSEIKGLFRSGQGKSGLQVMGEGLYGAENPKQALLQYGLAPHWNPGYEPKSVARLLKKPDPTPDEIRGVFKENDLVPHLYGFDEPSRVLDVTQKSGLKRYIDAVREKYEPLSQLTIEEVLGSAPKATPRGPQSLDQRVNYYLMQQLINRDPERFGGKPSWDPETMIELQKSFMLPKDLGVDAIIHGSAGGKKLGKNIIVDEPSKVELLDVTNDFKKGGLVQYCSRKGK